MDTLPPHASKGNIIPPVSGIYKITCTTNGKIYVGSAVDLQDRCHNHFGTLRKNTHKNPHLQRAYNKYGEDAFTFEIIELVLIPEMLTAREQYWFDKLKPFGKKGFNIARVAGSNLGGTHTPETREKLRQFHLGRGHTPETREKLRQANLGKKLTPEQLEKRRERRHTPESIEKMRARKPTEETRAKLRAAKSSPEVRERMRQARIGSKLSPETKAKVGEKSRGRRHTPEAIEKTRQASLGRNLGRKHSPETKAKMKQAWADRKAKME